MGLTIKVYFDYTCPFCIIAKKVFDEVIQEEMRKGKNIEVKLMPFEICEEGDERMDPINDPDMIQMWKNTIMPISNKLNMNLKIPSIVPYPYTNLTFQAFHYAKQYNKEKQFNDRVYHAFFYENQDIGRLEVIAKLCGEIGLNKDTCLNILKTGRYKSAQQNYLVKAKRDRIEVVPTFIIGHQRLKGIVSKEVLKKVINRELNKL